MNLVFIQFSYDNTTEEKIRELSYLKYRTMEPCSRKPAWQAFPYEDRYWPRLNWNESKDFTRHGVVGRDRKRSPAKLLIFRNAHWISRLSSFIDLQLCHRAIKNNLFTTIAANLTISLANLPLSIRVEITLLASMCHTMPSSARVPVA